jgi:hypothetical protein
MTLLFDVLPTAFAAHHPGGKVKTALPPGLRGDAEFSECRCYRRKLRRWIGDQFPERHMLFIGMNPSTADAIANDPTITREWGFAAREKFTGYVKINVGDYRATSPADLLKPGVTACSPENIGVIAEAAKCASAVVVCWGKVNGALKPAATGTAHMLRGLGIDLWCFGTNADGSRKHPLYLRGDTPLVRFG